MLCYPQTDTLAELKVPPPLISFFSPLSRFLCLLTDPLYSVDMHAFLMPFSSLSGPPWSSHSLTFPSAQSLLKFTHLRMPSPYLLPFHTERGFASSKIANPVKLPHDRC